MLHRRRIGMSGFIHATSDTTEKAEVATDFGYEIPGDNSAMRFRFGREDIEYRDPAAVEKFRREHERQARENALDHERQKFIEQYGTAMDPETLNDGNGAEPPRSVFEAAGFANHLCPYCRGVGIDDHGYDCGYCEGTGWAAEA